MQCNDFSLVRTGSSLVIHCSLIYLTLFIFNLPVIYKVSQSVKLLLTQRLY